MFKLIAIIALVLLAGGLVAGILVEASSLSDVANKFDNFDTDNVEVETTGLDDINLVSLLPLLQVFVGKAASFSEFTLPGATQKAVVGLNLTLPSGWEIAKDDAGVDKTYQTSNSTVIMVKDQDGDFSIITKTTKSDAASAQKFLTDTMNQQAFLLQTAGYDVTSYKLTMPKGQQALALDIQQNSTAIEVRGWLSGNDVYIINLTSSIKNLPVSEQVFGSIQ